MSEKSCLDIHLENQMAALMILRKEMIERDKVWENEMNQSNHNAATYKHSSYKCNPLSNVDRDKYHEMCMSGVPFMTQYLYDRMPLSTTLVMKRIQQESNLDALVRKL
jgi:hypothetical protein